MAFCVECGASLLTNARFCNKCGTQVNFANVSPALATVRTPLPPPPQPPVPGPLTGCLYHSATPVAGVCTDCKSSFCALCAVEILRHGMVCLDCGARFARRKLTQAYIVAGFGFLMGVFIAIGAASSNLWGFAILAPFIYLYFFTAVFFGWHYGGKIWKVLGSIADHFDGFVGLFVGVFLFSFRLVVSIFLGVFGGGIIQFLNYRKTIQAQEALATLAVTQAA